MNPYRGADVPEVSFSPLSLAKLKYIIGQMTPSGSCDTWPSEYDGVIFLVLILFKGALDYESFSTALYGESDL